MSAPSRTVARADLAVVTVTSVVGGLLGAVGLIVASLNSRIGLTLAVAGLLIVVGGVALSRRRVGWWVCAVAVMISGWDGLSIGPLNVPDLGLVVAVFAAVCTVGRTARLPRPPLALVLAVSAFALAYLLAEVFPPDAAFMISRLQPGDVIPLGGAAHLEPSSADNFVRLVLAILVMPMVVAVAATDRVEAVDLARAYVLGAVANAAVAVTDRAGVTAISGHLRGFVDMDGRQAGLTTHSNQLGLVLVMALPLAFFVFRRLPVRLAVGALLLAGVWLSGSRAAIAAALLGLALVLIIIGWRVRLAYAALLAALGLAVSDVLQLTRFGSASRSDHARATIAGQAIRDVERSPVWGIGPSVLQDSHIIYLEVLAGAGLIGFLGSAALVGWSLRSAVRLRAEPVFAAAGASLAVFLVAGLASNTLLARYLYVPVGILWAATALTRTRAPDELSRA